MYFQEQEREREREREKEKERERERDRQTDGRTDRQTDRQTERERERERESERERERETMNLTRVEVLASWFNTQLMGTLSNECDPAVRTDDPAKKRQNLGIYAPNWCHMFRGVRWVEAISPITWWCMIPLRALMTAA